MFSFITMKEFFSQVLMVFFRKNPSDNPKETGWFVSILNMGG